MGDWKEVFLPSHIDLSDEEKDVLTKKIETALRKVLDSEPEDIMIEYLQVMVLNSKNFAEISESMVELLEEADGAKICEMVAKDVKELVEKHEAALKEQTAGGVAKQGSSEKSQEDSNSKVGESKGEGKVKTEEDEEEDPAASTNGFRLIKEKKRRQPEHIALASAYKMYLHSGFAGAFQEYQDYLQGIPLKVRICLYSKLGVTVCTEEARGEGSASAKAEREDQDARSRTTAGSEQRAGRVY